MIERLEDPQGNVLPANDPSGIKMAYNISRLNDACLPWSYFTVIERLTYFCDGLEISKQQFDGYSADEKTTRKCLAKPVFE